MKRLILIALLVVALFVGIADVKGAAKTDQEIKQELIDQSIARYPGNCPCPYNTDRAGRRCGKRSAYSRPGGAAPLCYESDVTQEMVDKYRDREKKSEKKQKKPSRSGSADGRALSISGM